MKQNWNSLKKVVLSVLFSKKYIILFYFIIIIIFWKKIVKILELIAKNILKILKSKLQFKMDWKLLFLIIINLLHKKVISTWYLILLYQLPYFIHRNVFLRYAEITNAASTTFSPNSSYILKWVVTIVRKSSAIALRVTKALRQARSHNHKFNLDGLDGLLWSISSAWKKTVTLYPNPQVGTLAIVRRRILCAVLLCVCFEPRRVAIHFTNLNPKKPGRPDLLLVQDFGEDDVECDFPHLIMRH